MTGSGTINIKKDLSTSSSALEPMARIEARSKISACVFEAGHGEPLLYAALRAGVAIPYECATGTCGTCKGKRVAGATVVDWEEAPGNAYLRPDRNELLLCQARALNDCKIAIPGTVDLNAPMRLRPRFGRGVVASIETLTQDMIELVAELDAELEFDAGQFATLRVPGVPGYRGYSMVSHPGRSRSLTFVIKRKPGGGFTEWLFSQAKPGDPIEWFGPMGKAIFLPEEQRPILCIAGGSGIASIISILDHGCSSRHFQQFEAHVFFGVRTAADVFYLDRMQSFASAFPENLRITVATSHDELGADLGKRYPSLKFESGFPHELAARDLAGKFARRIAYLAGPPILIDVSIRMLITQGLSARDIRYDKFS